MASNQVGSGQRAPTPGIAASDDQLRLMARIARMYHEQGMRQGEIASTLHISQPRVSRLLKRAASTGIIRTIVTLPAGVHTDLEERLEAEYGLAEAVVADPPGSENELLRVLGAAAATYLETTLVGGEKVGISSWSASLLAVVDAFRAANGPVADEVVQLMGGVGDPEVQLQANRLIATFSRLTGGTPVFLPAPGLLGSRAATESLLADPAVAQVSSRWPGLTTALVGVGTLDPSPLLRESGNGLSPQDQDALRAAGAVGDVCLRFFSETGQHVNSQLDHRVMGIGPDQLRAIPRRIGIAGGRRKVSALRGALRGKWVNILVTDAATATALCDLGR